MPWTPDDATSHTGAANTPEKRKQWSDVANSVLRKTGDDVRAIKEANAAVRNHPASSTPKK